ncbi:conserved protein of unknown function [Limnospira indica PCC 8005]|uniref:Uncharacterized protein n=1 Tax=Limnospira indica PCC 8005 TaxID=376219 RepID=A0A9P1KAQ0_9CYAN|nr:conserved protein of unknown function [Limnospira indica PCC 8005]
MLKLKEAENQMCSRGTRTDRCQKASVTNLPLGCPNTSLLSNKEYGFCG